MTRDDIIKMARELDMIDFRDDDSDAHVAQFIDFLVVLAGKAEAATREECAKVCQGVVDGGMYDGWQQYAAAACRDEILARGEKGTTV